MTTDPSSPDLPAAPSAGTDTATYVAPEQPAARRGWRDRVPTGRKVVAAGAIVAGLAIGGAGFGAGYAVGDDGASTGATTQQTTGDLGGDGSPTDGSPGDGGGGPMHGQTGGGPMGGTSPDGGGPTGQAPDFDGDGQPDADPGASTEDGSTTDPSQNS